MIRYIGLDISGILMFIFLLREVSADMPPLSLFSWSGVGVLLSIPISYFILPKVRNKLVQGQRSFLDRRPPGGVWFFISIGAVAGFFAVIIEAIGGTQILNDLLLVWLSILICSFIAVGIYILILERRYKKKAFLRMPDGLVFLDR